MISKVTEISKIYTNTMLLLLQYNKLIVWEEDKKQNYNYLKIIRITKNKGEWEIGDKKYSISEGDIIILNNIETRAFKNVKKDYPLEMDSLLFLPISLYPNLKCISLFFNRHSNFSNVVNKQNPLFIKVTELFNAILDEFTENNLYKNEIIHAMLTEMLVYISRINNKDCEPEFMLEHYNIENYTLLANIVQYMEDNLSSDLSLKTISQTFGVSAPHLSKIFKLYNGVNYIEYLRRCRVQNALELIRTKNLNVLDAAYESGFGSSSGFYKAVKEITGMSPKSIFNSDDHVSI